MSEIIIKNSIFHIDSNEKNVYTFSGTINKEESQICYVETDGTKVKINIENIDNIKIHRKNKEIDFNMLFDMNNITENVYKLLGLNSNILFKIKTEKIILKKNKIAIKYKINTEEKYNTNIYILEWSCL